MTLRFARRMERLGTESAFEVLAQARALEAAGRPMVHLEIGEPDFDTPANIVEAGCRAMRSGSTHYTPAAGLPPVRAAIAEAIGRRGGPPVDPAEVVVVPGSKNILAFALLALIEPGDEVIIPDPGYPIYRSLVDFIGAVARPVPLREERAFRLDVDELATLITPRTRMIILNSPHNPTGGVLTDEDLDQIAALAVEHDLVVLSDEIYSQICFEPGPRPLRARPGMAERLVVLDGLSKTYAMCGWRLGFGVMPPALAERMTTLLINSSSCAAAFTQLAAVEALQAPESEAAVAAMVTEFRRRRDVLVDGLARLPGVRCHRPTASFYAFPNITGTGLDGRTLAHRLMHEAGVALLPGEAFGAQGAGFLRLAYTVSTDQIGDALERMGAFFEAVVPGR
ncbi:MAG TPA: pyridoxal phosphate-dependent aminotransferase [Candidatus Dormibacteraeota bacterium]|nr:pyridoxal phosphate-dependent aminotransferase [Candidatus Dormibacteraeota bacterium]